MQYAIRGLLPVLLLCSGATDQSGIPEWNGQALCADSTAGHRGEGRPREILGPTLGEFIFIAAGDFTMGRNEGENPDERPEHVVELPAFYVAKTPVTNSQFVRFLNEARIKSEEYFPPRKLAWTPSIALADGKWTCSKGTENHAASCASGALAETYCTWLSKKTGRTCRLPTEAEWEYVCRGKKGRQFSWGDSEEGLYRKIWGWSTCEADKPHLVPVGSYPQGATPEGVCDLIGYMDEVCADWYDPEYYARSPKKSPRGPRKSLEVEPYRNVMVARGGLERRYVEGPAIVRFFRDFRPLAILPSGYVPRGWSRDKAIRYTDPRFAYGRLGFRVVVDEDRAPTKGHARRHE